MTSVTDRVIRIVLWVAAAAYLIYASVLVGRREGRLEVAELKVEVADSARISIIDRKSVEGWIERAGLDPVGKPAHSVARSALNSLMLSHNFVASSRTWCDSRGRVTVSVTQRRPIVRFITSAGNNCYYTDDGYVLPVRTGSSQYVPVVTGAIRLPFEYGFTGDLMKYVTENGKKSDKNYIFFNKLINFVDYISHDEFWNAFFVQINVIENTHQGGRGGYREPEIELVPRVGDHIVLLGEIDGYLVKLDKLATFYRHSRGWEGWQQRVCLNLKFDNQIVCTK